MLQCLIQCEIYAADSTILSESFIFHKAKSSSETRGCPRGVMVKAMDCRIVVREFVLQSLLHSLSGKYPWERYEPPYPPSYGLNSSPTILLGE